ncbi:hypothetical protein [Sphingomonas sp. LT1P40]|uniref:hypothetical protein n=1 Tax=Alteristakelama amylovorans TaxID=3096166 RepID=UPI002FC8C41A
MNAVREAYRFLRWRPIPIRYAGKLRRTLTGSRPAPVPRSAGLEGLWDNGWVAGPSIPQADLEPIRALYAPRIAAVKPVPGGHPFTNLFEAQDISPDNPLCRFAFSREVLDAAHDYFDGQPRYNSIQLMYSWPTEGPLRESQMWHRDYGDSKSFHCIAYINDVLTADHGPFGFVDKHDTRRIRKLPIIRRISDDKFARELGDGKVITFTGKAGESVFVDPSACYHYGSRCRIPRLAVFVTFSTDRPYVSQTGFVEENRERFLETARAIRPDLSDAYLRSILSS